TGSESEPAAERPRWVELQGTVKVITGNWIVVRSDSGQLTLVDLSTVRGGASAVRPGSPISVYGTAGDQKFQAMGILQPDNRLRPSPPRSHRAAEDARGGVDCARPLAHSPDRFHPVEAQPFEDRHVLGAEENGRLGAGIAVGVRCAGRHDEEIARSPLEGLVV